VPEVQLEQHCEGFIVNDDFPRVANHSIHAAIKMMDDAFYRQAVPSERFAIFVEPLADVLAAPCFYGRARFIKQEDGHWLSVHLFDGSGRKSISGEGSDWVAQCSMWVGRSLTPLEPLCAVTGIDYL
jgi:hypothetical protein